MKKPIFYPEKKTIFTRKSNQFSQQKKIFYFYNETNFKTKENSANYWKRQFSKQKMPYTCQKNKLFRAKALKRLISDEFLIRLYYFHVNKRYECYNKDKLIRIPTKNISHCLFVRSFYFFLFYISFYTQQVFVVCLFVVVVFISRKIFVLFVIILSFCVFLFFRMILISFTSSLEAFLCFFYNN